MTVARAAITAQFPEWMLWQAGVRSEKDFSSGNRSLFGCVEIRTVLPKDVELPVAPQWSAFVQAVEAAALSSDERAAVKLRRKQLSECEAAIDAELGKLEQAQAARRAALEAGEDPAQAESEIEAVKSRGRALQSRQDELESLLTRAEAALRASIAADWRNRGAKLVKEAEIAAGQLRGEIQTFVEMKLLELGRVEATIRKLQTEPEYGGATPDPIIQTVMAE